MCDKFEERFDSDYVFDGTKDEVVQLWLSNQSKWYPDVLVAKNHRGEMFCSVTDVICENLHTMPLFCKGGSMRHVTCTSGETLHVCEAVRREEINPLPCFTRRYRVMTKRCRPLLWFTRLFAVLSGYVPTDGRASCGDKL